MTSSPADFAKLFFGQTHAPVGFTNPALSKFDGSPEPVIRELIQNSVDAADKANRPGEVVFKIYAVPKRSLPDWDAYEQAFESAVTERKRRSSSQTHDEKTIISRIRDAMSEEKVRILLCSDNGIGISPDRMESLLTSGNSDKGEGGAGSFGLGHHAAFAASDLRYVLYASRYSNGRDGIGTIFTGHAILATHINGEEPSINAADGYLLKIGQGELPFIGNYDLYSEEAPPVLEEAMADLEDTGTVVCITGFNDFNRSDDDPTTVESIAQVAVANFCEAIFTGQLILRVHTEDQTEPMRIGANNLREILKPLADKHTGRAPKAGQIRGSDAYRAYQTLAYGQQVTHNLSGGVKLHLHTLEEDGRPKTRVHLFRKGMWISSASTVPGLQGNDLAGTNPFDAVIALQEGELETLVRSAEGPEHRGLEPRRLTKEERKRLKELLKEVVSVLRNAAGERPDEGEIVLDNFAVISGEAVRTAEKRGRLGGGGGGKRKGKTQQGEQKKNGGGGGGKRKTGKVRSGTYPEYASSMRAENGTRVVEVDFDLREELSPTTNLGVRVSVVSGSDASCDKQINPEFLKIRSVKDAQGQQISQEGEDSHELTVSAPTGPQQWTIELAEPVNRPHLLELNVVRRRSMVKDEHAT